jgi:hypothetical protein
LNPFGLESDVDVHAITLGRWRLQTGVIVGDVLVQINILLSLRNKAGYDQPAKTLA